MLAISLSTLLHMHIVLLVRQVLVNLRMHKLNCNSNDGFLRCLAYLIKLSGNLHSVPYRLLDFDNSNLMININNNMQNQ